MSKTIKVLKDLRVLRRHAGYRHSGPTDLRTVFSVARAMARDKPSPYVDAGMLFSRSAGACPPRAFPVGETSWSRCAIFRSFRSYMSIEKRAGPMSRAFRSLIKIHAALAKPMKDLKDLGILCIASSIDIKVLRTLGFFAGTRAIDIQVLRT